MYFLNSSWCVICKNKNIELNWFVSFGNQQKEDERWSVAIARVTEPALPLLYVNQVGGQDEVVFDGASFFLDSNCKLSSQSPSWKEDITINNVQFEDNGVQNISTNKLNKISFGIVKKFFFFFEL